MPKKPAKKKRQKPISLFPLSLEDALRKALAVPFVAPKKKRKPKK